MAIPRLTGINLHADTSNKQETDLPIASVNWYSWRMPCGWPTGNHRPPDIRLSPGAGTPAFRVVQRRCWQPVTRPRCTGWLVPGLS